MPRNSITGVVGAAIPSAPVQNKMEVSTKMLEVNIARPDDSRVDWQVYIDGAIKVRQLNSGVVESAVDDGEWTQAL